MRALLRVPERNWVLTALLVRLLFALKLGGRFHQIDEVGYDAASWQLASQGVLGADGTAQAVPAVPNAFFALFYFVMGRNLLWPRLGQVFVGVLGAWLVGRMTRDLTGSRDAGRLALALSAVYPSFVSYGGMVMSETLYLAAAVAGLWLLGRSLKERGRSPRLAAAAGLCLGLAGLCRVEAAPIAAVVWLLLIRTAVTRGWSRRAWLTAVLCWALPLAGWAARNRLATGQAALDSHGGITLLIGTEYFELNEIDTEVAIRSLQATPFYRSSLDLPEPERDRLYFRRALAFMRENPWRTLRQWGTKFVNFWRFYPRLDKPYHETIHSHPGAGLGRWGLVAVSLLFEPWLILGGLWGLWRLRRRPELEPALLFLLGTMGVHLLSVSQMRYRLPVMPVLILGASALLAEGVKAAQSRGPRKRKVR